MVVGVAAVEVVVVEVVVVKVATVEAGKVVVKVVAVILVNTDKSGTYDELRLLILARTNWTPPSKRPSSRSWSSKTSWSKCLWSAKAGPAENPSSAIDVTATVNNIMVRLISAASL